MRVLLRHGVWRRGEETQQDLDLCKSSSTGLSVPEHHNMPVCCPSCLQPILWAQPDARVLAPCPQANSCQAQAHAPCPQCSPQAAPGACTVPLTPQHWAQAPRRCQCPLALWASTLPNLASGHLKCSRTSCGFPTLSHTLHKCPQTPQSLCQGPKIP